MRYLTAFLCFVLFALIIAFPSEALATVYSLGCLAGLAGLLWFVLRVMGIGHQGLTARASWSMFDENGEPRGVVVIDEEWRDHPDYHAPDKVYKYRQEK